MLSNPIRGLLRHIEIFELGYYPICRETTTNWIPELLIYKLPVSKIYLSRFYSCLVCDTVHSAKATPSQGHLSATERLPLLFLSFRLSLSTPIISPFLVYSRFLSFYFFFSLSFAQSIQSPCIRSTVLLCRKSNTSSDHRYHDSGSLLLSFGFRLYYKITFDHNQSPSITLVIHFWFKIFVVSITPPPLFFFFF